ncbi:MAG: hypothetical protein BJ554DRAFT_4496, partial [Olpidium bornovanus]
SEGVGRRYGSSGVGCSLFSSSRPFSRSVGCGVRGRVAAPSTPNPRATRTARLSTGSPRAPCGPKAGSALPAARTRSDCGHVGFVADTVRLLICEEEEKVFLQLEVYAASWQDEFVPRNARSLHAESRAQVICVAVNMHAGLENGKKHGFVSPMIKASINAQEDAQPKSIPPDSCAPSTSAVVLQETPCGKPRAHHSGTNRELQLLPAQLEELASRGSEAPAHSADWPRQSQPSSHQRDVADTPNGSLQAEFEAKLGTYGANS